MHAALRSLDSPDVDPLERYEPESPDHFGLVVVAHIGPADGPGTELFTLTVCSPSWLADTGGEQNSRPKGFQFIRHHLLLDRWDVELLHRAIGDLCRNPTGDDWTQVANKLSRFLAWEFEDYQPRPEPATAHERLQADDQ